MQRQHHHRNVHDPEGVAVRPELDTYHAFDEVARRETDQREGKPVAQEIETDVKDDGGDAKQRRGDEIALPGGIGIGALATNGLDNLPQGTGLHPGLCHGKDEIEIIICGIVIQRDEHQRDE